ncbi:MAG TPA: hypothetical protein DDW90_00635 [Cyanobacteria bacterium UBA9971]|nr:hypothetical protein [Cyanobacteria bacterium UBA9971]
MKEESLKKQILGEIEHKKTLWTAQIVLVSGLSALILNLNSIPKIILLLIGFFFEYLILSTIKDTDIKLQNLYKELEK